VTCDIATAQDSSTSKTTPPSGKHSDVQLSETLHTQDDVEAKLTPGQKKAVTDAKKLRTDGAAIYNEDGKKVKEGSSKNLAYEFKACKDPKSISDRCWVCKDGRIFCKIPASQSK